MIYYDLPNKFIGDRFISMDENVAKTYDPLGIRNVSE